MKPLFNQGKQVVIFDTSNVVARISAVTAGNTASFVSGFCKSLLRYTKALGSTKGWFWVTEGDGKTRRQRLFGGYKSRFRPMAPLLETMLPLALTILKNVNCRIVQAPKGEADDAVACVVANLLHKDPATQIIIVSEDKDLWQLVKDPWVTVYGQTHGTISEAVVKHQLKGVPAAHVCLWKALVGDASDNLPRVPGLNHAVACKLATRYRTPKNLYRGLKKARPLLGVTTVQKQKLLAAKAQVKLTHRLVKLKNKLAVTTIKCKARPKALRKFLQAHEVFDFKLAELHLITHQKE